MSQPLMTLLNAAIVRDPLITTPETRVMDAIAQMTGHTEEVTAGQFDRMYLEARSSCVFVEARGQLVGLLTERDIVRLNADYPALGCLTVGQVMANLRVSILESRLTDVLTALNIFHAHQIRYLPVLDEQNHFIGFVTPESLLHASYVQNANRDRENTEHQLQQLNDELETKVLERTAQLLEREQFLQTVLDTFPLSIFWKDRNSVYLGCNRNFLIDAGLDSVTDLIGKTDFDMPWGHVEAENYRADDQAVMESNTAKLGIIETLTQSDGSLIWLETNKLPLHNLNCEVIGVLGTYQDISAKKQLEIERELTELELKKSRLNYYALIQSVNGIVWEYDLQKNQFTFVSDKAEAILGYPLQDWLTEPYFWRNHVYSEDILEAERQFDQAIQNHRSYEMEYRMVAADGRLVWIGDISTLNRNENGDFTTFSGILIDISDRKQAEAQLQETNAALIRATRLKDEFLANMSHELRTPLNAILGMTEGLMDGIMGSINERQAKTLKIIEDSGNHLLALITDILDVAKIEAGQIKLDRAATSMLELCQSSLAFVQPQATKKRIRLRENLPAQLPDLWLDGRRLIQVLTNLLSNAVKFTPEGGQVTLDVTLQPMIPSDSFDQEGTEPSQALLQVAVTDTGIGIAADDLDKLFQPFIQIDASLNRQHSGTGLGLALVKRLVELHGGWVEVTSEVGVGSYFAVTIPCDAVSPASKASPPLSSILNLPSPNAEESILVLVVEDNAVNAQTVSSYLCAKGYDLLWAQNGQEGIDLAQSHNPHIILMDIQMPGMDGLETIRRIREDPILADVPIIALTGLAMDGDHERCLAAGANDYLSKPMRLKQLVNKIQHLLGDV